jgi:predicted dehydrogenase
MTELYIIYKPILREINCFTHSLLTTLYKKVILIFMFEQDLNIDPELPNNKTMGIGCIGASFIMNDCHLVAYRKAGFNPIAIASKNPKNSKTVAKRHQIPHHHQNVEELLKNEEVQILDIAVPATLQADIIRKAIEKPHIKAILAQKPLAGNYEEAKELVELCEAKGIRLGVNQNMRYDQSIRGLRSLLQQNTLGEPVIATINMRAVPHWPEHQKSLGWVTLRTMSIHHLDTFRFLFGEPERVFCSVRKDPRTLKHFDHSDGICMYILEYANGFRASAWDDVWAGPDQIAKDNFIHWRVEGEEGLAKGSIGWPEFPNHCPSTLDYTSSKTPNTWHQPRWDKVWFPDAFIGTMAQLMIAVERDQQPEVSGRDHLNTMALVDACYKSVKEHRAIELSEITKASI